MHFGVTGAEYYFHKTKAHIFSLGISKHSLQRFFNLINQLRDELQHYTFDLKHKDKSTKQRLFYKWISYLLTEELWMM